MDPNACYHRWSVACAENDMDEASEAWRDLAGWIRNGGFAPDWTERQAAAFRDWAPTIAPCYTVTILATVRLRASDGPADAERRVQALLEHGSVRDAFDDAGIDLERLAVETEVPFPVRRAKLEGVNK